MESPRIWIDSIDFNDNTKIALSENDIVVLVGPNNSGKSASLNEMVNLVRYQDTNKVKILKNVNIQNIGSIESIKTFIRKNSIMRDNDDRIYGFSYSVNKSDIEHYWNNLQTGLQELAGLFISHLTTSERLRAADPPSSIRLTSEPPQHPIHYLQKNDAIESQFSSYFRKAFGTDLIVHRNAGGIVPLYVGDKPIIAPDEDRVSMNYIKNIEKLDLLNEQGDGMRSFVGVLLHAFIAHYSILFIDEPEAFLHPPQARLLGKMLAKNLPSDRQLFLSTHSEDFLKGLLDANTKNLKIIRIQRNGSINNISLLNNDKIEDIWKDSLLRHSNILNGLFHKKVIMCESDSDSRFYSAILSSLFDDEDEIAPDILFVNVGGKHRFPVAIKALNHLNVPIMVVSDFDVLNNINPIKEIYEDLGGRWTDVDSDWQLVKNEIERKRPEFLTIEAKEEIEKILTTTTDRIFPKERIKAIQSVLKKASPWTEAKANGKSYIPSGGATQAFERIQAKFKEKGLHIVEVGEVEGFAKTVGNHGPKWTNEVLTKDLKNDPELETARQFIRQFI